MVNIVDSIGFDLERVHTGLIVYLVDLWRDGKGEPLQTFFSELGVNLGRAGEISVKKEHENIDLVLFDRDNALVAIEMKVHNHEICVDEKKPRNERNYQTIEYPKRVRARHFLYVTLGTGELYRRKPYGKVQQVGLDRFLTAVKKIAEHDSVIEAWERALSCELKFRAACKEGRRDGGTDAKKWNVYFLGFLRRELDRSKLMSNEADFTAYRHSQDTILNTGIKRPPEAEGAYCYMEINGNGRLNLKANLESSSSLEKKRDYVGRAKDHYVGLLDDEWSYEPTGETANLKKSRPLLSFDVGIEKQNGGFFGYTESKERSCEKVGRIVGWFLEKPAVETN